jgi:AcrR family transcriptional regulator
MNGWSYDEMKKKLDAFGSGIDPSDPRERKRLLIVEKAAELFAEQGFRKTSVDQIAKRAGVAKGSVYLHFKSKPEILLHAVVEEKKVAIERFRELLQPERPPRWRLRQWLKAALVMSSELPLTARMLGGDRELLGVLYQLGADRGEDWLAMQHGFLAEMIDLAARPHSWTQGELMDRARVLFGLLFFANELGEERVRGGLAVERFAEILADMVVDGIGPSSKGEDR